MRLFKTKHFAKWAKKANLNDCSLIASAVEIENGLIDANLGGNLIKKRISLHNRGKRNSVRVILAYKHKTKIFFLFGFDKNDKDNISKDEHEALKIVGNALLSTSDKMLLKLQDIGDLIQLGDDDNV